MWAVTVLPAAGLGSKACGRPHSARTSRPALMFSGTPAVPARGTHSCGAAAAQSCGSAVQVRPPRRRGSKMHPAAPPGPRAGPTRLAGPVARSCTTGVVVCRSSSPEGRAFRSTQNGTHWNMHATGMLHLWTRWGTPDVHARLHLRVTSLLSPSSPLAARYTVGLGHGRRRRAAAQARGASLSLEPRRRQAARRRARARRRAHRDARGVDPDRAARRPPPSLRA